MFVRTLRQPTLTTSGPDHDWFRLTAENDRAILRASARFQNTTLNLRCFPVTFALGDDLTFPDLLDRLRTDCGLLPRSDR